MDSRVDGSRKSSVSVSPCSKSCSVRILTTMGFSSITDEPNIFLHVILRASSEAYSVMRILMMPSSAVAPKTSQFSDEIGTSSSLATLRSTVSPHRKHFFEWILAR